MGKNTTWALVSELEKWKLATFCEHPGCFFTLGAHIAENTNLAYQAYKGLLGELGQKENDGGQT